MKQTWMACVWAVLALLCGQLALAEGVCPPGQYPIGGQGMVGCAPIPGYGGSGGYSDDYTAPTLRRVDIPAKSTTPDPKHPWGAVSIDEDSMVIAHVFNQNTKGAAMSRAMAECQRKGGQNCGFLMQHQYACVVVSKPADPAMRSYDFSIMPADTVEAATRAGNQACQSYNQGAACHVIYQACEKPHS